MYKYTSKSNYMATLDLDSKKCVLCQLQIPILNEFIANNHVSLARKVSEEQLYVTMATLLDENKTLLERQHSTKIPTISAYELQSHFTEHEISMVSLLMDDLRSIRKFQKTLTAREQTPSTINSYLRLSKQSISLMNKLDKIDTFKSIGPVYKFD